MQRAENEWNADHFVPPLPKQRDSFVDNTGPAKTLGDNRLLVAWCGPTRVSKLTSLLLAGRLLGGSRHRSFLSPAHEHMVFPALLKELLGWG